MRKLAIAVFLLLVAAPVYGEMQFDDVQGGTGAVIQGFSPRPAYNRTASLGTKGFKCYSTYRLTPPLRRKIVMMKAHDSNGDTVTTKLFFNGDESYFYPIDEHVEVIDKNVISICQRAYSSATPLTSKLLAQ